MGEVRVDKLLNHIPFNMQVDLFWVGLLLLLCRGLLYSDETVPALADLECMMVADVVVFVNSGTYSSLRMQ